MPGNGSNAERGVTPVVSTFWWSRSEQDQSCLGHAYQTIKIYVLLLIRFVFLYLIAYSFDNNLHCHMSLSDCDLITFISNYTTFVLNHMFCKLNVLIKLNFISWIFYYLIIDRTTAVVLQYALWFVSRCGWKKGEAKF